MSITVKTGTALKGLFDGKQETEAAGATVGEVLGNLGARERICGDDGKVRRHFNIHINEGEDIRLLQGLDTPVEDGDTVTVLSAIAGGGDVARRFWLTFPADLVERPLLWEVGQKFKVVTNIRRASVTKEVGILGVELSGEEAEVRKAVDFIIEGGVSVEPVELGVVE